MQLPELLLPAGGFDAAIAAFEGGADAIYLGLRDFSARKQAKNFDDLEYRRVLGLARDKGKKVYVAMNTLVTDEELPRAAERLAFLSRFLPDALIFQDWGLASLAASSFPELELHASTQTAVQTAGAVGLARELGVSRIVLPRETGVLELAEHHEANPDMEFEVFVHGALCYSYSGLCLASGLTLGRSGNRGDCAQLCRSWYRGRGALEGEGYWFSCRDLELVDRLGELARAGAASFKVEGRMKSPEYVGAVAALYRGALDRLAGEGPDEAELSRRREAARVSFSRGPTAGWSGHHGGQDIIDAGFPGHRGLELGEILSVASDSLLLELRGELGLRDGLQVLGERPAGVLTPSLQFPALELRDPATGRRLLKAEAGQRVRVSLEGLGLGDRSLLRPGAELHKISSRSLDRRSASPEEYEPLLQRLSFRLRLGGAAEAEATAGEGAPATAAPVLELELPSFDAEGRPSGRNEGLELPLETGLQVEVSRRPGSFARALELFRESGSQDFRLEPLAWPASLVFAEGYRGPGAEELFVPPSQLKRAKNEAYARVRELLEMRKAERARLALSRRSEEAGGRPSLPLPPRSALVFADSRIEGGMPFATPALLAEGRALPEFGGWSWLPLAPLVASTESYLGAARSRILGELAEGRNLALGLGALHHLAFARELLEGLPVAERARLVPWIDVHLYVANRLSLGRFASLLPNLGFAYDWLEAPSAAGEGELGSVPRIPVGEGFNAPLFLSKACLIRHHLGEGHCPVPCGKRLQSRLGDRNRSYVAIVEDCVSMLFRAPTPG